MYNWYDDENNNFIAEIEYVKGLYDAQAYKVKQEEYVKNLMFADYVKRVKNHRSRYDYIQNVFKEAQGQIGKKKKKEREQLSVLEDFIRSDFLNNDKSFKIVGMMSGGYESYYWNVEFEGYGQTFYISIPMMDNINTKNIGSAHDGMFAFIVRESSCATYLKKKSYKIEDVAEYIKSYFGLDKVNEDDD
jgi:hypothetical protein